MTVYLDQNASEAVGKLSLAEDMQSSSQIHLIPCLQQQPKEIHRKR